MALYGKRQLVESMRAVRANTIAIATDIPGDRYDYRATPMTRSIGETLVHIAWLFTPDLAIHEQARISTVEGFDFVALMKTSDIEEKRPRPKDDIIALLLSSGESQAGVGRGCVGRVPGLAGRLSRRRLDQPVRDAPRDEGARAPAPGGKELRPDGHSPVNGDLRGRLRPSRPRAPRTTLRM